MEIQEITKMIMNPVRMRMMQYFLLNRQGTATQVAKELNDVPKASLYRHIKVLEDAGIITVIQENKKRGMIEKVYHMNPENPFGKTAAHTEGMSLIIQTSLMSIMGEFQRYLQNENNDPNKDMLFLSTSTLLLSDSEFETVMEKIGDVLKDVIRNQPNSERKPRRMTLISSPAGTEE